MTEHTAAMTTQDPEAPYVDTADSQTARAGDLLARAAGQHGVDRPELLAAAQAHATLAVRAELGGLRAVLRDLVDTLDTLGTGPTGVSVGRSLEELVHAVEDASAGRR